jgi:hypothetical protein
MQCGEPGQDVAGLGARRACCPNTLHELGCPLLGIDWCDSGAEFLRLHPTGAHIDPTQPKDIRAIEHENSMGWTHHDPIGGRQANVEWPDDALDPADRPRTGDLDNEAPGRGARTMIGRTTRADAGRPASTRHYLLTRSGSLTRTIPSGRAASLAARATSAFGCTYRPMQSRAMDSLAELRPSSEEVPVEG